MRKVLGVLWIALLAAGLTGCQCCEELMRLEAWKNQTLFGCLCPCLHQQPTCPPAATCPPVTTCPPTSVCPPTYSQPLVAPLTTQPMALPSYSQSVAGPYFDCAGATIVGSPVVDCSGLGGTIVQSPICQDGCGTGMTGAVITPGPTLTPTPVPTLVPQSYAPPATR